MDKKGVGVGFFPRRLLYVSREAILCVIALFLCITLILLFSRETSFIFLFNVSHFLKPSCFSVEKRCVDNLCISL